MARAQHDTTMHTAARSHYDSLVDKAHILIVLNMFFGTQEFFLLAYCKHNQSNWSLLICLI